MSILTAYIARLSDGVILAGSLSDEDSYDLEPLKKKAKQIMKKMTVSSPKRLCIEDGRYTYHYIIEQNVIFLALCSASFPKTLAFQFLEELSRDFLRTHAAEVEAAVRPYACVSFDVDIEKKRRAYIDKRQKNKLDELNEELVDVKGILSKNLEDVIGRGEKIDVVTQMSGDLVADSKRFRLHSAELERASGMRQYLPYGVVLGTVVVLLILRSKLF